MVFEGVLDGTGKEHDTDADPYYLAGIGSVAFQGNKIREIVVKENLGQYKLHPSSDPNKNDASFDNQNLGTFTIGVGEEYKRPITFTQASGNHVIYAIEGFKENGNPVQIENSSYFKKNSAGKYVATKPGILEGQCLFYDIYKGKPRVIATSQFTYKITNICKITFVNGKDTGYAAVNVEEGKSISDNSVSGQKMPAAPSKDGYTFKEWNTQEDGQGKAFTKDTVVSADMTVYAVYDRNAAVVNAVPTLILQDKTITAGDELDLRSLIVSANDPEDGDLKNEVKLVDKGGFDNTKPGTYTITFTLADKGKASVTKSATVTVKPKSPQPEPKQPAPSLTEPAPETEHVVELPPDKHRVAKTGESAYFGGFSAVLSLALAALMSLRKKS